MFKTRAALPIASLKDDILHLLKEKDVLVVCGETGSGKTTQVQFIFKCIGNYFKRFTEVLGMICINLLTSEAKNGTAKDKRRL